jgi:hypothetical protein
MMNMRKIYLIFMVVLVLCWIGSPVIAADLKEGTIIDATSLDTLKNDTFEGKTIGSMVAGPLEYMIKKEGLWIKVVHSKPVPIDPRLVETSTKNRGKCKLNPKTRLVENWEAGWPFPDISKDDPDAGIKIIYNQYYGAPHANNQIYPGFAFLFIDMNKGLERTQVWTWQRYFMKGRVGGPENCAPTEKGAGNNLMKLLLLALEPRDVRGLGTYTVRYDDGKFDDSWAYIKSVRRVRRLTGGGVWDAIGGTDMLNDDQEIFNANPTWYPKYNYLGRRWILAAVNGLLPAWDPSKRGNPLTEFPRVDFSKKPFCNPNDVWEPVEVDVVECIAPPDSPYSKKIIYSDARFPSLYFFEAYDKKGQFWKFAHFSKVVVKATDGSPAILSPMGHTYDLQSRHCTVFANNHLTVEFSNNCQSNRVTLGQLEVIAGR